MKKKFILMPLVGGLLYLGLSSYSSGPGLTLGATGDRTGATAATVGCGEGTSCHATSATAATTVSIQLYSGSTAVSTYTGGMAYTIKITGTNTGTTTLPKFGFQVSTVKTGSTTVNEGTLSAVTGTHMGTYGGINIVEHSAPINATSGTGGTGTTYVISIPWTAPVAGSGSVTVYAVLNAVNGDGLADAQDLWNNTSLVVPEATTTVDAITGTTTVCTGASTPLADATSGGAWSSSAASVATVGSTGIVTGVTAGTATISYNAGSAGTATAVVTVSTVPPTPAAITGSAIICVDKTTPLEDATTGGAWSSSNTSLATVAAGVVTGVAVGTDIISYTVTNSCGSSYVTHDMSVRAAGSCAMAVAPLAGASAIGLNIFPNPNDGSFTVNLLSGENEQAIIIVTNIVGATVSNYATVTNKELNIKLNAAPGIYFISATTAHGRFVEKMIVN